MCRSHPGAEDPRAAVRDAGQRAVPYRLCYHLHYLKVLRVLSCCVAVRTPLVIFSCTDSSYVLHVLLVLKYCMY